MDPIEPSAAASSPSGVSGNSGTVTDPVVDASFREAIARLGVNGRGPDGRFLPGNVEAATTLERSGLFWAAVDAQTRELTQREAADLGLGPEAPAAVQRLVAAHVECSLLREALWLRIAEAGGPTTRGGRQRALLPAFLAALAQESKLWRELQMMPKTADGRPVGSGETFDSQLRERLKDQQ